MAAYIVGVGQSPIGKTNRKPKELCCVAVRAALADGGLKLEDLDGLIAVPALCEMHTMSAHRLCEALGMETSWKENHYIRTVDAGGASPISALIDAKRLVESGRCKVVAVVAGDSVGSLSLPDFLTKANEGIELPPGSQVSPMQPLVPLFYEMIARWHMRRFGTTREQLAMVAVLMSRQAAKNPESQVKIPVTFDKVLSSPHVGECTSIIECARRSDGAGAVIVVSSDFVKERSSLLHQQRRQAILIAGGAEAAQPFLSQKYLSGQDPNFDDYIFPTCYAVQEALKEARLGSIQEIQHFSIYDCFPIAFIKSVEDIGLATAGKGGTWVEELYRRSSSEIVPINTHGGLLGFAAPWEAPAIFSVVEAVRQLRGTAGARQVPNVRNALVHGNGGVLTHEAIVILKRQNPVEQSLTSKM